MLDNRFSEPIYFQEEIIREYANNRKALEEKDVKDLLRCLVKFLQQNAKEHYAFDIPHLGTIYNNSNVFNHKDKLYSKKMGEYFCGNKAYRLTPLFKKHNKTKEELQQHQNELFEEN